jgi:HEAT repeat protein
MRIELGCLLIAAAAVLAADHGRTCIAQAPPTIESELRRYGIQPTQSGLQSALKDSRPEARSLAAGELGSMKDMASIPLIAEALEKEKDQLVRLNMAAALVRLNSPVGKRSLLQICGDSSQPHDLRLSAALRLFDAGDPGCLSPVENILEKTKDPTTKISALLMLARVKPIPESLVPRIHDTLLANLTDPTAAVRQYAARCISSLGDKAAAASLRIAISNESDGVTRGHMVESLKALEDRP